MRDGVILRADIYRPKAEGKFPVLLTRTPYDKQWQVEFALKAAPRGYVVIAQDTRGQFPLSKAKVVSLQIRIAGRLRHRRMGRRASLLHAKSECLAAPTSEPPNTSLPSRIPPHLAGMCPNVTASNYYDGWTYQGGAFGTVVR